MTAATSTSREPGPEMRTHRHQRGWTRLAPGRPPATRLFPGGGAAISRPATEISNPAVAAAREQTSPEADAANGRPSALAGSSLGRAPERRCAPRSCALSCDGGAAAFVRRESRPDQAADQRHGCERQMPGPAQAPSCQATLQRASRRISGCGGTSRLTSVELVTAATASSRDSATRNLSGCGDFPERPPTSNHDGPVLDHRPRHCRSDSRGKRQAARAWVAPFAQGQPTAITAPVRAERKAASMISAVSRASAISTGGGAPSSRHAAIPA